MRYKITLMALAIICVMVVPAFSMPNDRFLADKSPMNQSPMNMRHERCPFLADNLTDNDLNNITIGQLAEMRLQSRQNTTFGQAKEWRPDRSEIGPMEGKANRNGEFHGFDHDENMAWGVSRSTLMVLLMADLSVDKLNDMTPNQIEVLQQTKMDELNDMTVNQIKELHSKRMQEQNNMTLSELKEENQRIRQISQILDFARCRHDAGN